MQKIKVHRIIGIALLQLLSWRKISGEI